MKWISVLLVLGATPAAAQQPVLDSAEVTVSPDCGIKECWPYGVVLSADGEVDFAQALVHKSTRMSPTEIAQLFGDLAQLFESPLPEPLMQDEVLCPATGQGQPVITISIFRGATIWRREDFRWCNPVGDGATFVDRRNIVDLRRLRRFEDAVVALPFVTSHVKQ